MKAYRCQCRSKDKHNFVKAKHEKKNLKKKIIMNEGRKKRNITEMYRKWKKKKNSLNKQNTLTLSQVKSIRREITLSILSG